MFIEIATTALIEQAWHGRAAIGQFGKDLYEAYSKGKFKLFTFGPGGVGKTILGKLISGEYSLESVPPDYDLSLETEKHGVDGRFFMTCYVPPGQEIYRPSTWDDLYREIDASERYAIINVCCWGYHSLALLEFQRHALYKPNITAGRFLGMYLRRQRLAEIAALKELVPRLKTAPKKLRMLTLITKQDLWWSERHKVQAHYEDGEYNKLIEELRSHRGQTNFSHDYVSASLNLLNFKTKDDILLTPTVGGYDNAIRIINFNNTMRHIKRLMG